MSDITKCEGWQCEIKEHCLRFTAPGSAYQSWAHFDTLKGKDMTCDYYIDQRRRSK